MVVEVNEVIVDIMDLAITWKAKGDGVELASIMDGGLVADG